ncbi:MAG: CocE/NonD family hydrolase [Thermoanaerobaculia bacterium]|nr:CocE/NonD family hydrolase [Thermoanaerobaculia bacterium]
MKLCTGRSILLLALAWIVGAVAAPAQEERDQTRALMDELGVPERPRDETEGEACEEGDEDCVPECDEDDEDCEPEKRRIAPEDMVPLLQAAGVFQQIFVEKNVSVLLRDDRVLKADVFRPQEPGEYPAIITLGPYPKDIHFKDWNLEAWQKLEDEGEYMHWETASPQWWVPQGYVVVRVDARGTGASEAAGNPNLLTEKEALDFYDAIEWAATRRWSNGRVAVMGISYFSINAWRVAALRPPSLAAVVIWEGAQDLYGDVARHGGILSNTFIEAWLDNTSRYARGGKLPIPAAVESEVLTEEIAATNPDLSKIDVPLLSAGNWGGVGLHLRGNVYGWLGAASPEKMLRLHVGDHVTPFYSVEGRALQKRFLDRWLRDIDTGIDREPPIKLAIRTGGNAYVWRYEYEWPLQRTRWTELHLESEGKTLRASKPGATAVATYSSEVAAGRGSVAFTSAEFDRRTEITGPIKLKLWISTTADDADLFVVLRNMAPDGREVTYPGSNQPKIAAAYGWLRASHRKLDAERSRPWRPVHSHDEIQKLEPGAVVPVEIEVLPTSFVLGRGHRLVVEVGASDDPRIFPFTHTDPEDRIREGQVSIHTGGGYDSHVLLPVIHGRR